MSTPVSAGSGAATNAPVVVLAGRVLLSILFIIAGFGKLTSIGATAGFFGSLGLPLPTVTAIVVGLVELLGGLAILVGFKTRIAAIVLAIFTVGATAVAHLDFSQAGNALMLQKNLGLIGGFLLLAVLGAGPLSIDGRLGD
ncbi:DoxX family protein [Mesorhizobium sp. SP-1A]|jgi:putative oxidoreductase|uniref:DoxX family protein n=1 Tax=Mesorhizobium sp. SP-1A TaxID=3077840 RepID=UPI0028F6F199|nr:DoxX family protein [Mesorhizobium sp. SP-1A]